jgi:hypothetical protein
VTRDLNQGRLESRYPLHNTAKFKIILILPHFFPYAKNRKIPALSRRQIFFVAMDESKNPMTFGTALITVPIACSPE